MADSRITGAIQTVREYINRTLSAEECFCLILSSIGEEQTKLKFRNIMLQAHLPQHGVLQKQLNDIYCNYFSFVGDLSSPQSSICSTESYSFGEQLDIELALALSVAEVSSAGSRPSKQSSAALFTNPVEPQSSVPSYASKAKGSQKSQSALVNDITTGPLAQRNNYLTSKESGTRNVRSTESAQNHDGLLSGNSSEDAPSKRKKKKKRSHQAVVGIPNSISNKPVIYWLRRDIRLHDNPALVAAFEAHAPVIIVFLWSEAEEGPLAAGGATKYWLHHALSEFDTTVQQEYSNRILFRKTENSVKEMLSLVSEVGAGSLVVNNLYEPCLKARDDQMCSLLQSKGVEVKRFDSYLLHEPSSVSTESKGLRGFGSVLHFMECCRQSDTQAIGVPVEKPPSVPISVVMPFSQPLQELGLARLPRRRDGTIIDWAKVIRESWDFSENGAWDALELFVDEGIRNYEKESGRADMLNTSRISPYIHFGQVSPRAVLRHAQGLKSPKFLRKLAWRDLSYWLLSKFPDMPSKPIRIHYQNQQWSNNKTHLKAWQKGQTGFPLVDAAMRQLWLTGWMNNYTRHVVASFLISYLRLNWTHGYAWFQDTLLDADVAINAMMWQNGGMSGLDQWNFVMHPVDAALTCDPKGHYVRQWCPELAGLPDDYVHKPWKCPPSVLRRAGVELGKNYPHRVLTDLEEAREQSLLDAVAVRLANPQFVDNYGNDLVPLPCGKLLPVITRKEFKYKTSNPEAKDNPHTAVLRGYRSRKRDEAIAFANQVDFTASTVNECTLRHQRIEQSSRFVSL